MVSLRPFSRGLRRRDEVRACVADSGSGPEWLPAADARAAAYQESRDAGEGAEEEKKMKRVLHAWRILLNSHAERSNNKNGRILFFSPVSKQHDHQDRLHHWSILAYGSWPVATRFRHLRSVSGTGHVVRD